MSGVTQWPTRLTSSGSAGVPTVPGPAVCPNCPGPSDPWGPAERVPATQRGQPVRAPGARGASGSSPHGPCQSPQHKVLGPRTLEELRDHLSRACSPAGHVTSTPTESGPRARSPSLSTGCGPSSKQSQSLSRPGRVSLPRRTTSVQSCGPAGVVKPGRLPFCSSDQGPRDGPPAGHCLSQPLPSTCPLCPRGFRCHRLGAGPCRAGVW